MTGIAELHALASRFLPAERVAHLFEDAPAQGIASASFDHSLEHPPAISFIAIVELALVLVDVFLRSVMRRVIGARTVPHVPGLVGF